MGNEIKERLTEDEFVPYELALDMERLGFSQHCMAGYDYLTENKDPRFILLLFSINKDPEWYSRKKLVAAPLFQQAFKWFYEQRMLGEVFPLDSWEEWTFRVTCSDSMAPFFIAYDNTYDVGRKGLLTYADARLSCLEKMIEIAKAEKEKFEMEQPF